MALHDELAEAEAKVAAIKARMGEWDCAAQGHRMKSLGGANASCGDPYGCCCSVPVHTCEVCGDSDYGDNAEARRIRRACKEEERERADEAWFFDMDGKP